MIKDADIEKLASLARIKITPEEAGQFRTEIESILEYVAQIQKVSLPQEKGDKVGAVHNVLRDDNNPHESGLYTKEILAEAPDTEKEYIQVKNIL